MKKGESFFIDHWRFFIREFKVALQLESAICQ